MPIDEPVLLVAFIHLAQEFEERGFKCYLVGGSVRDYLLGKNLSDMDVATDATVEEMKSFLPEADYTFAKYGSIKCRYRKVLFDITTFRKEKDYKDFRHPGRIEFTKNVKIDVKRRDFTINALYLTRDLRILDHVGGKKDLEKKIIRMIGEPDIRLKEDPLRIIRALRFSYDLDFEIEPSLKKAMEDNLPLLKELNIEKIKQEIAKCAQKEKLIEYLKKIEIL